MQHLTLHTARLTVVAAITEMFLGVALYAIGETYISPAFIALPTDLSYLSAPLVVSGMVLLLPTPQLPWVRRMVGLLVSLPLAALARYGIMSGNWAFGLVFGILAAALLTAPWLAAAESEPATTPRPDLFILAQGLIQLTLAGLIPLWPEVFAPTVYQLLPGLIPWAGATGLAGAAALLLPGSGQPWAAAQPLWRRLVATALPLVAVYALARAGAWGSAAIWAAGAAALLVPPALYRRYLAVLTAPTAPIPAPADAPALPLADLAFVTIALGFLLADAGPMGHAFLALIVAIPPLASWALGPAAGERMLYLALAVVGLDGAYRWQFSGVPGTVALAETAFKLLVVVVAAQTGMRTAAHQRRLIQDLVHARGDLQKQVDRQALLDRIGRAIRSSLDLDEILHTTVNELGPALGASRCYVRLRNHTGDSFPILAQYAAPGVAPVPPDFLLYAPRQSLFVRSGRVLAVSDVANDPDLDLSAPNRRAELVAAGAQALLGAPLSVDGKLLGTILFHECTGTREWTPAEVAFVEAVASQVAVGVAHAWAHRALAERHAQLQEVQTDLLERRRQLVTQHETLQAQNTELLRQRAALRAQQLTLEAALDSARVAEEARARLVVTLEATTDLVCMADASGRISYLNGAGRHVLALTPDDDVSRYSMFDAYPNWARSMLLNEALPAALKDGVWSGETSLLSKDGRVIPVSQVLLAHRTLSGEVEFFSTIIRDISAHRQAEDALRESEERFRSAFDNAATGMTLNGLDGRLLQVNRALCDMLGYTEPELLALTWEELTHPDDLESNRQQVQKLLSGELRACLTEKRYLHRLGHAVWVLLSSSLVRDPQGLPLYFLGQVQDITERKLFEGQLVHAANYDPLTELFNRRRFQQELDALLAIPDHRGALLFLDLDDFKYVNDSLGHWAGDELLRSVAVVLQGCLEPADILARLGGDEFAILLPGATAARAAATAEIIVSALRQHTVVIQAQPVGITTSIGVAVLPDHGSSAEELLACADLAMYQAKECGRNSYSLYIPDQERLARMETRLTWEKRIRTALEQDLFLLYWQPILDLHHDKISQYELLLRMRGEQGQIILPQEFLHVAERYGLIHAIDRWVVRQAIRLIAQLEQAGTPVTLEVNLSGKAFADSDLLGLIQHELTVTGIDPARLVLEITETAAIADSSQASRFIETLKEWGCRFAIDDFGTGFSSFYYLKHLPVDYLKIDGSFIRNLPNDPADQHLVKAMVEVAQGLGKQTIAEYVGDAETIALLKAYGVDSAQGYFIGKPVPVHTGDSVAELGHRQS